MKANMFKLIHTCENITDWDDDAMEFDTTSLFKVEGLYSIYLITAGGGVNAYMKYTFASPIDISDFTHWVINIRINTPFTAQVYEMEIYTSAGNYGKWTITPALALTWYKKELDLSSPDTEVGTLDLTSIAYFIIRLTDNEAGAGRSFFIDYLYCYRDVESKIANCIIWSPMYQGSQTPRPFGYPRRLPWVNWDKRYQFCLIRVGKSNESYFQEKDIIHIQDDSDNTSFYGRISTKQDRLTSYLLWCYSWGDEFIESIFPNAYSAKKSSDMLEDQIEASSKSTHSSSIDATTITYTYNIAKPNREFVDLVRYMERGVFWRVPGYDGKCYFDKDITDVNILPDSGETWTKDTAGINYLGKMSYAFGITRAHVWGAKNSKEQVNKKSAITAEEQETGVVGIFPYIDSALTNYTEVNQLATALKNIYSATTLFINLRVHGKEFLQWGKRVSFSWDVDGKLPTADDYMILEWIYDAKNDVYLRFILTNNIVFEREFINIQKQLGKDVYISADYIDVGESESSSDGTVLTQSTLAELRSYEILDEDAMGSDKATALATQQSIKAYVDALSIPHIAAGTYTGNTTNNRTIVLGWHPEVVMMWRYDGVEYAGVVHRDFPDWKSTEQPNSYPNTTNYVRCVATGFEVDNNSDERWNASARVIYYIAWG